MYDVARKYGLTGTIVMVYEALVSLCRKNNGSWKGSFPSLASYSLCGSDDTAGRHYKELLALGLITQNAAGETQIAAKTPQNAAQIPQIAAQTPQIAAKTPQNAAHINNINKKESNKSVIKMTSLDGQTDFVFSDDFDQWWGKFAPPAKYDNRKVACFRIWEKLPADWKRFALARATNHAPDKNPYFYLQKSEFLPDQTETFSESIRRKIYDLVPAETMNELKALDFRVYVDKNKKTHFRGNDPPRVCALLETDDDICVEIMRIIKSTLDKVEVTYET